MCSAAMKMFCNLENAWNAFHEIKRFDHHRFSWCYFPLQQCHWNWTVHWIPAFQGRVGGDTLHPPEPDPVRVGGCGDATRIGGSQESCKIGWNGRRTFLLWGWRHSHMISTLMVGGSWKTSKFSGQTVLTGCMKSRQGVGRGSKNPQIFRTSYVNGPQSNYDVLRT